jgi:hypothetical protein
MKPAPTGMGLVNAQQIVPLLLLTHLHEWHATESEIGDERAVIARKVWLQLCERLAGTSSIVPRLMSHARASPATPAVTRGSAQADPHRRCSPDHHRVYCPTSGRGVCPASMARLAQETASTLNRQRCGGSRAIRASLRSMLGILARRVPVLCEALSDRL